MLRRTTSRSSNRRTTHAARRSRSPGDTIILVAATALLGLFCYAIYPDLSPFVLFAGLLFLIYPFRDDPVARRLMQLGALFFIVWFLSSTLGVLAPFIIAFILAYIVNPVVVALERRRVPPSLSSWVPLCVRVSSLFRSPSINFRRSSTAREPSPTT
jgi:predicted PurR-regulated permease PerM